MIFLRWRGLLDRVGEGDSFVLVGLGGGGGGGCVGVWCGGGGGWGRCRCAIFSGGGEMT